MSQPDEDEIYEMKNPIEHILDRPDTYIGSVLMSEDERWVYDKYTKKIVWKKISYVPGLYKIFGNSISPNS